MIQKIVITKVELPPIFLVETKEDFETLPKGIPYIVGNKRELSFITIFLEFQVLYRSCMKTGIPINWLSCLQRIGYNKIRDYKLHSGGEYWESDTSGATITIDDFVEDIYFVDFDKLSELKILPVWLDDIKTSIETNIINEVQFNPLAFNKQLSMNIGYGAIKNNKKNLLILDISGSIPDAVAKTITQLAKLMSKRFYADVILTGGSSIFLDYEEVMEKSVVDIAATISRNNEGIMFKAIVEQHRDYNTVICFGDDDHPQAYDRINELNSNFTVETLYSLHTDSRSNNLAGYCRCFKPKTTILVRDWVQTIKK